MTLQLQADAAIAAILVEAEMLEPTGIDHEMQLVLAPAADLKITQEIAARCMRAAYALGYQAAHQDERPFPITQASAAEREAWARLPLS